ncbi:hypothetical protein NMY22_g16134 [Coprinellus aureogranulatus]|nr:hypothetical protein NMY22_g16134 [Coprinellus aureogranulatus]
MAKVEEVVHNLNVEDLSSSRTASLDAQSTSRLSTEQRVASRAPSPYLPGAEPPRIPSLDLEGPTPASPTPSYRTLPLPGPPAQPVVSQQPEAKEEPTVGALIPMNEFVKPYDPSIHKPPTKESCPPAAGKPTAVAVRWRKFLQQTYVVLVWIWRVLLVLMVGIGIIVLFAVTASIGVASAAGNGAMWTLVGNRILYSRHHSGYIDSDRVVATVGAIGGMLAFLAVGLAMHFFPRTSRNSSTGEPEHSLIIRAPFLVAAGALTGVIGVSLLELHHFDLQGLDTIHAVRAGALGATVMMPATLILLPFVFFVVGGLCWALFGLG